MIPDRERAMGLDALLETVGPFRATGKLHHVVREIVTDSRQVRPGALFVAVPGLRADGHDFAPEASRRGAVGLVVSRPVPPPASPTETTVIEVSDTRKALARLSAAFYGNPSSRLRMIGVTGTNGKTTTTHLIREMLRAAGRRVAMFGTVTYEIGEDSMPAPYTTPDPPLLQRLLAGASEEGIGDVVLEVSSHALDLDRVLGCDFEVAVFTNLTQDHLDFHGTFEAYFAAKQKLFSGLAEDPAKRSSRRAVINRDDSWGRRLLERTDVPAWSFGLSEPSDIRAVGIEDDTRGIRFRARTPAGEFPVASPLMGSYNVYNLLAAIGAGLHCGATPGQIQEAIRRMARVPGRFESVEAGQDFTVIVDYAHTEAALERLLLAVGPVAEGRIIVVFGCGGDRDPGKRAPMGRAAARLADRVIITTDNPRSEDPLAIIREVERGVMEGIEAGGRAGAYETVPDRRQAIERAVSEATRGDFVVVAGKGHEDYQIVGDERLHFDDRETATEAVRKRMRECGS